MNYLLPLLAFIVLVGAYYVLIGRKRSRGEVVGFLLAIVAALPLLDGGLLLVRESGRWQDGRVGVGVVVGKLSSTGEGGSPTIGGRRGSRASRRRVPRVVTSDGFMFHDVLARVLLTGSRNAWIVEYRYPCDSSNSCHQRELVNHALWSDLRIGQTVNVRTAKGQNDPGRLDENPMWNTALAKLAIGGTLGLLARFFWRRSTCRRRTLLGAAAA